MAIFESYERRIDQINAALNKYDISSIEEAKKITDEKGIGHFYGHPKVSAQLAEEILTRLKYDNNTKKQVLTLVEYHDYPIEATERSVKRSLRKFTPELFFLLLQLKRADNLAQHPNYRSRQQYYDQLEQLARNILDAQQCFSLKDLAVKGNDLASLG